MIAYGILISIILAKEFIEKLFGKRGYLFCCCITFIFVYGISSETMGLNDRQYIYSRVFKLCSETNSLTEVIQLAQSRISSGIMFYVITWIISLFTSDYNVYLFLLGIPLNVAVTYYIGKYSNNTRLSFLIYLALIYPLTYTVVRQCIAMSVLMVAIEAMHHERWKKAVIFILLASTIHLSVLVFLLVVIFKQIKYYRISLFALPIGLIVGMAGGNIVLNIFSFLVNDETYSLRYSSSNGNSMAITAIAIRAAILIFLFLANRMNNDWFSKDNEVVNKRRFFKLTIKKIRIRRSSTASSVLVASRKSETSQPNDWFLWNSTLSAVFVCLMNVLGEFQRIAAYFDVFIIISIPRALASYRKHDRMFITILLYVFLIVYFLGFQLDNWNMANYTVFWA